MSQSIHKPVLLHEIVEGFRGLTPRTHLVYLDGTLGGAGHALAVAASMEGALTIVGLDRDMSAVERARTTLQGRAERIILVNEDFRNLDLVLAKERIDHVDLVLLDLGISSDELDNSGKGFSFSRDEPLLMTMGEPERHPFTARNIVNDWQEDDIANVIFGYGEERYARRIARAIVSYRERKQIETSGELAEIVRSAVPGYYRRGRLHPATKTFQALRITVNDELNALKDGLTKGYEALAQGGRMAVISFHSLEDRIVKQFFRDKGAGGATVITKRPIIATDREIRDNPRSRSAKLRIVQK